MTEIFIFFFISSFILVFTGRFFLKLTGFKVQKNVISLSEQGLYGIIFLSFLSLFLNFFFKIDQTVSSLVILIPLVQIFLERNVFSVNFLKRLFHHLIIISFICTVFISHDNVYRPDAGIYHLPYVKIINDFKIFFGVVSLNPVFGATSILQYTASIFNNLIFKDLGVTIPLAIISIYLIDYFVREFFLKRTENIYKLFLFIVLSYIFLEMNRYSEYGNDNVGHLFLFYLVSLVLRKDFNLKSHVNFKLFTLIALFIFLNKVFLFLILAIPVLIWLKKKYYLSKKFYPIFSIFFFFLWIIKNVIISGCVVYPLSFTCNDKLDWYSNNSKFMIAANNLSQFSELHAKGWSKIIDEKTYINYDNDKEQKREFLKHFNWIKSEKKSENTIFGFYKIFNNFFFLIVIALLLFLLIKNPKRKQKKRFLKFEESLILIISLISLVLLLYKFPLGRYGTSYFVIILFYLTYFFLRNNLQIIDLKRIKKTLSILIIITGAVFILKNVSRIIFNFDTVYYQSPWPRIYENRDSLKSLNSNSNLPVSFKYKFKSNVLKIYYVNKLNYWTSDRSTTCMYNYSPCAQSSSNFDNFEIIKTPNNYYKIKLNKD